MNGGADFAAKKLIYYNFFIYIKEIRFHVAVDRFVWLHLLSSAC